TLFAGTVSLSANSVFNLNSLNSNFSYTNLVQDDGLFMAPFGETVGAANAATYTQAGGTHTVTGTFFIGDPSGTSGGSTYTLQSGLLTRPTLKVSPGSTFNLQGGTMITPVIAIDPNGTFRGHGLLNINALNNDGTLSANWGNLTVVASQ